MIATVVYKVNTCVINGLGHVNANIENKYPVQFMDFGELMRQVNIRHGNVW